MPESSATLRQVLSHTSAGAPAGSFHYDPERYSQLTPVVESRLPQPRKSVAVNILERLAMRDSVPGRDLVERTALTESLFLQRDSRALSTGPGANCDFHARSTSAGGPPGRAVPGGINAAGGLVTTVRDFARYDAALDEAVLLSEETLGVAWSSTISADRTTIPTGLGWFVQATRANQSSGTSV